MPPEEVRGLALVHPRLAGHWYPRRDGEWRTLLPSLFAGSAGSGAVPRALVVPHAGLQYSGATAAQAWLRVPHGSVRRVILLGPAHSLRFPGLSAEPARAFGTPFGELAADEELRRQLEAAGVLTHEPRAHAREHSVEVQLPFVKLRAPGARVLPLLVGTHEPSRLARIAEVLVSFCDEHTLLVFSSDFVHYGERFGYFPSGEGTPRERVRALDQQAFCLLEDLDPEGFREFLQRTGATICGAAPLEILLRAARRLDLDPFPVAYQTSGDLLADWSSSVSYAAFVLEDGNVLDGAEEAELVSLARQAVQAAVAEQEPPLVQWPAARGTLRSERGAFVTLRRGRELRGCVGRMHGLPHLAAAVRRSARSAARQDHRFPPVTGEELGDLSLEISVLGPLLHVADPREIQPGLDGIALTAGERQATFLPQVAREHGLDTQGFWMALCRKAGLPETLWDAPAATRWRFRTHRIGPVPVVE